MKTGVINYKNGTTELIAMLHEHPDGLVKFVSESGKRYAYISALGGGIFTEEREILVYSNGAYRRKPAMAIIDTIQSISYPSETEFEYTISNFSGKVEVPRGATKEEIKKAIDRDVYRQLRKIPADEVQIFPGRIIL